MNVSSSHQVAAQQTSHSAKQKQQEDIQRAAAMLEGVFLRQLLKEMRATVPENSLTGGSMAESVYFSMFDEAITDEVSAGKNGVGLRELLIEQLGGTPAKPISAFRASQKFSQMATASGHDLKEKVSDKLITPSLPSLANTSTPPLMKPLGGIAFEAPNRPEPVKLQDTDGKMIWPLTQALRADTNVHQITGHAGDDVVAAGSGKIIAADAHSLVIEHRPGLCTKYSGLGKVQAQVGDLILRGQNMGQVGQSGTLDFEVLRQGQPLQLHEINKLFVQNLAAGK